MTTVFHYIYLRIYQFFKEKGDSVPEFKGTLILSLAQFFTVLDILIVVKLFKNYSLPPKLSFIPLMITIGLLNWYTYERGFDLKKLEDQWRAESSKERIVKGWVIGLYIFVSLVIPVVYGYLKHNLKAI